MHRLQAKLSPHPLFTLLSKSEFNHSHFIINMDDRIAPLIMFTGVALLFYGLATRAEILREHYSRWVAIPAALILIIANIALVSADLVAVGSGLELITGLSWFWFVVPVTIILWYLTVYRNFETIKKVFIVMSLAFVTYIITAILSGANWQAVLFHTFVPQVSFSFASASSAVALLGATISPYTMFWLVQGEKEEARVGTTKGFKNY